MTNEMEKVREAIARRLDPGAWRELNNTDLMWVDYWRECQARSLEQADAALAAIEETGAKVVVK